MIITGIIGTIARHVTNSDRHPAKKDIVFEKVCKEKHDGLDDCIEGKIQRLDEKFDTFREDVKGEFAEVKALIRSHVQ